MIGGALWVSAAPAAVINTRLNDQLALGGDVAAMQVSSDGNRVVNLADSLASRLNLFIPNVS
jgi:hypothetical protein